VLDNVTDSLYTRHITKEIKMISIITTILLMFDPNTNQCQIQPIQSEEYRGCCSWHGGVCGCSGGRAVCCDNTLSPSCGC